MKKIADFFRKKQVKTALIVLLCLVVLLGAFALYVYPWDNVARGIRVNGKSIGGKSIETATELIKNDTSLDSEIITVKDASGATLDIQGADIGLSFDYEKTVEEAYKIGRTGDFFADAVTLVKNVFVPCDISYKYGFDGEKLTSILYDFGVSINGEMKPYTIEYEKDYVKVSQGVEGQNKDISDVVKTASEAISEGVFDLSVTLEKANPPAPFGKALVDYIYTAPVDATYSIEDGVVKITDEIKGISVSEEEVKQKMPKLIEGETITLKIIDVEPDVTRNSLYRQLFNHTLGSFTSRYSVSNRSRTANVALAAKLINGMVLSPGETFSYNKAVGPRTSARGFKEATVYSNGESVMGIGGGICQVSSTLYSAVLYADLEIVERKNHSMTVDYMPKGQDATVSYGTIDFKFRNNTQNPIRINATASGGVLSVSISGTKPETEKTVKITNSIVEVINKTTTEIPDDTLAVGETKTEEVGKTGYVVDTYKKVYENGVEVKSEYVGRSRYRMVPQKRRVGTKQAETPSDVGGEVPAFCDGTPVPEKPAESTKQEPTVSPEPTDVPDSSAIPEPTPAPESETTYAPVRPEANALQENSTDSELN